MTKLQAIHRIAAIRKIAGIIALAAVIGFSIAACSDDGGGGGDSPGGNTESGVFTLTGIPAEYNGMWACAETLGAGRDPDTNKQVFIGGAQSISFSSKTYKRVPISNGIAKIPMWLVVQEIPYTAKKYSGNHTLTVGIYILKTESGTTDGAGLVVRQSEELTKRRIKDRVVFSNGSATRDWSQGTDDY